MYSASSFIMEKKRKIKQVSNPIMEKYLYNYSALA
jgi:hypothetical protein